MLRAVQWIVRTDPADEAAMESGALKQEAWFPRKTPCHLSAMPRAKHHSQTWPGILQNTLDGPLRLGVNKVHTVQFKRVDILVVMFQRRTRAALLTCATLFCALRTASAAPVEWKTADGGNGHFYDWQYLGDKGNTWEFARAAAASRSYLGVRGHLATITSAAEQSFISRSLRITVSSYLGGVQATDSPAPDQGWSWITGEPWELTYWATTPAEPTDGIGPPSPEDNDENRLSMYDTFFDQNGVGRWNDVNGSLVPSNVSGYVVEFPVPEPSSVVLLAPAAFVMLRRRKR